MTPPRPANAPTQSLRWLRPFIPKRLQPWLRGVRKRWELRSLRLEEPFRTVFPYTQVSPKRQENLLRLANVLEKQQTEGAVVECGVLDGGTATLMAFATQQNVRPVHLFDAWEGLPETVAQDGEDSKKWVGQVVGSPKRVTEIMKKLAVPPARIHIHHGWFEDTFPHAAIEKVALLHIDCDFYEPTALYLQRWYPHLVAGGFVQFDDYSAFQGCKKAVDEFLASHPELKLQTFGEAGQGEAFYIQKPA